MKFVDAIKSFETYPQGTISHDEAYTAGKGIFIHRVGWNNGSLSVIDTSILSAQAKLEFGINSQKYWRVGTFTPGEYKVSDEDLKAEDWEVAFVNLPYGDDMKNFVVSGEFRIVTQIVR